MSELILPGGLVLSGWVVAECRDRFGHFKWIDQGPNLIVNEGINYMLDAGLSGGTPVTAHFLGLKGTGAIAATDTAAQIGGTNAWTELTSYSQANRVAWSEGGPSSQQITNSGSPAVFSINGTMTVDGVFLVSTNTKLGTTGRIIGVKAFAASRAVISGDTINVTYTITGSSS